MIGAAAIEKIHPYSTRTNTVVVTKDCLDQVLVELNPSPSVWRFCQKYLNGKYQYVQINPDDLMWFY